MFYIHTHAAILTSTGGVGTSDNRLNTNHLIGIIFGILGLVVPIITSVSILLVRYYICHNTCVNKKQETNLVDRETPSTEDQNKVAKDGKCESLVN